jgi:hypothetical protein
MSKSNAFNKSKIETMKFRSFGAVVTAANIATVPLNAAGLGTVSTRFAAMLDQYGLYRLKSFKFRILKGTAEVQAAAVLSDYQDSTGSTPAQIDESLNSQVYMAAETCRLPFVNVPRSILAGALPWYKSIPGSIDSWEEVPASLICFTTAAVGQVLIEQEWEAEFKDQVPPANTPEARLSREARGRDQARSRLLNVLTGKCKESAHFDSVLRVASSPGEGKPPSAPARRDNEQTRQTTGDSDLRGKLFGAQISALIESGK